MRSAISMFFKIEKGQTEQHKLLILCIHVLILLTTVQTQWNYLINLN